MNYKRIAVITITLLIVLAGFPFCAVASVLEATAPGVNVLGLPAPVITGIDAKNSIVQLKADGYLNDNAELVAIVSLVDDNGNVIDTAEKK